jgi:hypothetical protein
VVAVLNGAGALDPTELAARWRAFPGTTYDWAASPPPAVDPPALQGNRAASEAVAPDPAVGARPA